MDEIAISDIINTPPALTNGEKSPVTSPIPTPVESSVSQAHGEKHALASEAREELKSILPPEQKDNEIDNSWKTSEIIAKLQARKGKGLPLRIAFFDIDSTLNGNPEATLRVRQRLDELGFVTVFVTSRTEEMVLSKEAFNKSKSHGLVRPEPQLTKSDDGKMLPAFADELEAHQGLYDPDVIEGTTGSVILVKQKDGGYKPDTAFTENMRQDASDWRAKTMRVLQTLNQTGTLFNLLPLDMKGRYEARDVDVFPPDFRIQLEIVTTQPITEPQNTRSTDTKIPSTEKANQTGLENKQKLLDLIGKLRSDPETPDEIREQMLNIRVTDDSNPDKGKHVLYLTPNKGWKARSVEHTTTQIQEELDVERGELHTLFAGDSYPDVGMGLQGALGTDAEFLVVGGSRLTDVLSGKVADFGGMGLTAIQRRMTNIGSGEYAFKTPLVPIERKVILGDIKYSGTKGPETIISYLDSKYPLEQS